MKGAPLFSRKLRDDEPNPNDLINKLLVDLNDIDPNSEEYLKVTAQLVKLYDIKAQSAPKSVSPDTLALVAGNLLGIAIIVGHERAHVVTSKALSFVQKVR